jgi:hypothetical protein
MSVPATSSLPDGWSFTIGAGEPPALGDSVTEFREVLSRFSNRARTLERWCDDSDGKDAAADARQKVAALASLIPEITRRGCPVSELESGAVLTAARAACNAAAGWVVRELKKPAKSALKPRIEFQPRMSSAAECDFDLLVRIDNEGSTPDAAYKLEVTIPRRFVRSQSPFLDEASSTGEIAFFRRPCSGESSPPAIYVGQNTDPVLSFRYRLRTNDFMDGSLENVVRAVIHRPDGGRAEVSRRLAELHDCHFRDGALTKDR